MINLPPFLTRDINLDKINLFKKVNLIIFGKFLSLVINKINGNLFCLIINTFLIETEKSILKMTNIINS